MRAPRQLALRLLGLVLAWTGSAALFASDAVAQSKSYGRREPLLPIRLDGHVASTWRGSLGLGVRADLPVVPSFAYSPRDELAISVGIDVTLLSLQDASAPLELFPTVALQWSIGATDRLYFVPELGLAAQIERSSFEELSVHVGFATRYYLRRSFGLQLRLGWPVALTAGVVF